MADTLVALDWQQVQLTHRECGVPLHAQRTGGGVEWVCPLHRQAGALATKLDPEQS